MWNNCPVIAMVAKTDFASNAQAVKPEEVVWKEVPPMWTAPAQVFRDFTENITFRLNVDNWHKD